jgi:hypothetical protein
MDMLCTQGARLDVYQEAVMACRLKPDATSQWADDLIELQACGTMTRDLLVWSEAGGGGDDHCRGGEHR